MPPSILIQDSGFILDACSAIVLYASGHLSEIVSAMPCQAYVAAYVVDEELKSLDLRLPLAAGILDALDLEGDEEAISALHYGTDPRMDAGEAVCAALAHHRDLAIATDDAGAISFLSERLPEIQLVTSADIVGHWATSAEQPAILAVIQAIRDVDGYVPHKAHPLRSWWFSYLT